MPLISKIRGQTKFICILLSIIFTTSIIKAADAAFVITGKFDKIKSGIITLDIYGDEEQKLSSKVVKGFFTFTGFVQKPSQAILYIKGAEFDYLTFYIEPGSIEISGKGYPMKDLIVSNSILNDEDKLLKQQMEAITKWQDANTKLYEQASRSKNKLLLDSLDDVDFEVLHEKRKIVASFVKDHPQSLRSAIAIAENYAYYAEADEVEPLYNLLDDTIKNSPTGHDVKKLIALYKTVAVGIVAPDIIQATPQGTPMSLSSLRGNYVLVDFWASWCAPCRRENPNVVKLFNEYKSKGLDIFGVSYDTNKDKWQKAIKDDGLTWNQVSDLKGWKNATSDLYGIKAIPSNLLLDKDGRIIAKNIFGKKLADKLAEVIR
ncbi:MAG: TlpA disulfide reductase family protein [Ginsengibacter sp.]